MKLSQVFSLLFLSFAIITSTYADDTDVSDIPSFMGGIDEVVVNRCNAEMDTVCHVNDGLVQYLECAKKTFANSQCDQNAAFLEEERGFFDVINQYGNVSVVKAKVYAADHSEDFFMVDKKGELVQLVTKVDLTKSPHYHKLSQQFKSIELMPSATSMPQVEILAKDGTTRVVFSQLLLNGCHSCEQVGIARIAYDFSVKGEFLGVQLIEIIPTNVPHQA